MHSSSKEAHSSVWFRPPAKGPCPICGLTRGILYRLWCDGVIESRSVRAPGKARGCRLYHTASVLKFIEESPK